MFYKVITRPRRITALENMGYSTFNAWLVHLGAHARAATAPPGNFVPPNPITNSIVNVPDVVSGTP